ncbi:hypothetical protein M9H77_12025 [Catharanthus roseus]|uniref:Uncharacterized protein n=1 Tax=Catharanthus roseus TaxID=4058 RepID=A0ACC0BG82_CATRO|nr:hypothetical protein M9H77_12025 [Catharanthus roseus]
MVKVKNANVVRGENYEEVGSSRGGRLEKEKTRKVGGRDTSFDDRMLNTILGTLENGIRFYTKNKKCFDPNPYSEKRFEELFTKGEVLKSNDDRNINKLDTYGRLLHHKISNIIIPNVGHKFSITNMHSFILLALHEHRRMNFGFMAIEHMLATQTSSTKYVGERRTRSDEEEEEEEDEGQDAMNVDEVVSEEPEEETFRREMRQKKRQEMVEEGQSSRKQKMLKRSLKKNLQRSKRSLKTTRFYEYEVIKLKTLKTRRMLRYSFIRYLCNSP